MLAYFETYTAAQACPLLAAKDIPEPFQRRFGKQFHAARFSTVPGMPTAWLNIDFASIDEYLSRLSAGTRKDMRRKLRSLDRLRVDYKTNIDDVLPRNNGSLLWYKKSHVNGSLKSSRRVIFKAFSPGCRNGLSAPCTMR